jgi:Fe-Mn family superoxide dismutase
VDGAAARPIFEHMKKYVLPDLRYDYGALEPHISGEIMRLHHDKHHRAYVDGANTAMERLAEARQKGDFARVAALEHALAFNLSGHVLHSLFWQNLAPDGGDRPDGILSAALARDFGGFDAFRAQMIGTASTIMGSGWAVLAWDPIGRRLVTAQIHDHQSEITQAGIPLLVLDAWEHAYYLQYRNEKAKYFQAVWNLWNWSDVQARFEVAKGIDLRLDQVVELGA